MDKPMPSDAAPLTIEQLEIGLRILDNHDLVQASIGGDQAAAFRQTVLLAIRETSDALLSPTIPLHWRAELESQLQDLLGYLEIANRIETSPHPAAGRPH
jgi:hypothetical protein